MPNPWDEFPVVERKPWNEFPVAPGAVPEPDTTGQLTKLLHGSMVAWPREASNLLGALSQVVPGGAKQGLTSAADYMAGKVNPEYERQGQELAAGTLTDPMTYLATVLQAVPMVGKYAGAQLGGAAAGGAMTKSPWGAVAGGIAAPFAVGGLEGKYLKEKSLRDMGIDADIAEEMANKFGMATGGLMTGVSHAMFGRSAVNNPVSRRIISELGSTALAGVEMGGLSALDNLVVATAVKKMKDRKGGDWEPAMPVERQDPLRQGVLGAAMVGAAKAVIAPYSIHEAKKARDAKQVALGKDVLKALENDAPAGVPEGVYFNPYVDEPKYREYRARLTKGATTKELATLADTLEAEAIGGNGSRAVQFANTINKKLKTQIVYTEDTPLITVMSDIRSHLGFINEGPQWGVGKNGQRIVITAKPLHAATPEDVEWHNRVNRVAKRSVDEGVDTLPLQEAAAQAEIARLDVLKASFPAELQGPKLDARIEADKMRAVAEVRVRADVTAKAEAKWDMQRRALVAAGLSEDMAEHPGINPKPDASGKLVDQNLGSRLTRDQLARYDDSMEGQARQLIRGKISQTAYNTLDAMLFQGYTFPEVRDPITHKPLFGILPEDLPSSAIGLVARGAPYRWLINKISTASRWPFERLYSTMDSVAMAKDAHLAAIAMAQKNIMSTYPKEWTRGVQRRDLNDLQHFIGQAEQQKGELKNQWAMEGMSDREVERELAGRVLKNGRLEGGEHTVDNIIKLAGEASAKMDIVYRWYARNGVMDPKLFSDHYRPLVYEYEKAGETKDFAEFIQGKREYLKATRKLTDDQIEQMVNFGDTIRSLERKGFAVVGQNPMFAEHLRSQDREFRKLLTSITDDRYLLDVYSRQAANRIFYEDIAPVVAGLINRVQREMTAAGATPQQHAVVKQVVHDWLKSMMGVPELETQIMRRADLRAGRNWPSKLLDRGLKLMNTALGYRHDFSGPLSPDRVINDIIGMTYARFLGVQNPTTAFVQNFASQLPLATIFGMRSLMKGVVKYESNKAFAATVDKLKLGTDVEERIYQGQRGHAHDTISSVSDIFMSGMMWSDTKLRRWAASSGLVNWEALEKLMKEKRANLTERDMEPVLFAGKSPKFTGLSDVEVAKNGPTLEEKYRVSDKRRMHGAVANDIYNMIQEGKTDQARDLYLRYVSEVSQWRYGRGGSSMLHRTPMKRLFFMFMQYPQNYLALHQTLISNRMLKEEMKLAASQLVMVSLFSALGYKVGRWMLAGPLPNKLSFTGPIVDDVSDVLKFLYAGQAEVGSQLLPTMTDEERDRNDKAWDTELQKVQDLFDVTP